MKSRAAQALLILTGILLLIPAVLANAQEQRRYLGTGPGYPDLGAKYFYRYYPEDQWGKYGYGTGHMGQGYGPYIYHDDRVARPLSENTVPLPLVTPGFKKVAADRIEISLPDASYIRGMTVNVVGYSGAVLETATVSAPPYAIGAHIPYGAELLQVHILTTNGFTDTGYRLAPE